MSYQYFLFISASLLSFNAYTSENAPSPRTSVTFANLARTATQRHAQTIAILVYPHAQNKFTSQLTHIDKSFSQDKPETHQTWWLSATQKALDVVLEYHKECIQIKNQQISARQRSSAFLKRKEIRSEYFDQYLNSDEHTENQTNYKMRKIAARTARRDTDSTSEQ